MSLLAGLARSLAGGADDLAELVLPRICASCRAYGRVMRGRGALCPVCDRLLMLATLNVGVAEGFLSPVPCVTAGLYEYELARVLLAYKNAGRTDLLPLLRSALGRALVTVAEDMAPVEPAGCERKRVLLVPLPSSPASVRRRGFEPAAELARTLPQLVGGALPHLDLVYVPALGYRWSVFGRGGVSQKSLGRAGRSQRMRGALRLRQPALSWAGRHLDLSGQLCVLCDDVITTGASLAEAARVLRSVGAYPVAAVAVARVARRSPEQDLGYFLRQH